MSGIGDVTMDAVTHALSGLRTRSDVRAHNIANANTPGFRAMRVDFESNLAAALDRAGSRRLDADAVEATLTPDPNLPGPNGNTVSLEGEMVGQMEDNLLRSAMVNAFNFKANMLRTAIGRR